MPEMSKIAKAVGYTSEQYKDSRSIQMRVNRF